jgi:hypothetical protein
VTSLEKNLKFLDQQEMFVVSEKEFVDLSISVLGRYTP